MLTIARSAKPLKKSEAFAAACALKNGETLPDDILDGLLLYFAPAKPKAPKTAEQWVASAAATDKSEVRHYLKYVYVTEGTAYGTDGATAHAAKTDLPDGWYDPKTLANITGVEYRYPNVERVMLNKTAEPAENVDFTRSMKTIFGKPVELFIHDETGVGFDMKYINLAFAGNDNPRLWLGKTRQTLHGENPFGRFTVMAMRY